MQLASSVPRFLMTFILPFSFFSLFPVLDVEKVDDYTHRRVTAIFAINTVAWFAFAPGTSMTCRCGVNMVNLVVPVIFCLLNIYLLVIFNMAQSLEKNGTPNFVCPRKRDDDAGAGDSGHFEGELSERGELEKVRDSSVAV